jgi:hypothetical protein
MFRQLIAGIVRDLIFPPGGKPMVSSFQIVLIAALILLAGLYLLRQSIPWLLHGRACKKWPFATGKITDAPESEDSDDRSGRSHKRPGSATVLYSYSVDGKEYDGDNVSFDPEIRRNPAFIRRVAEMYTTGDEVRVYYDPKRPEISVLRA